LCNYKVIGQWGFLGVAAAVVVVVVATEVSLAPNNNFLINLARRKGGLAG
jgi:hypothetical protein